MPSPGFPREVKGYPGTRVFIQTGYPITRGYPGPQIFGEYEVLLVPVTGSSKPGNTREYLGNWQRVTSLLRTLPRRYSGNPALFNRQYEGPTLHILNHSGDSHFVHGGGSPRQGSMRRLLSYHDNSSSRTVHACPEPGANAHGRKIETDTDRRTDIGGKGEGEGEGEGEG